MLGTQPGHLLTLSSSVKSNEAVTARKSKGEEQILSALLNAADTKSLWSCTMMLHPT